MKEDSNHDDGGKESCMFGVERVYHDEFLALTNITYRGGMTNHFHEKFKRSPDYWHPDYETSGRPLAHLTLSYGVFNLGCIGTYEF